MIKRGASTSSRATGTIAHFDEYFTKEQDERLTLRVVGGRESDEDATLAVVVTATSHPRACPVGTKGTLALNTEFHDPNGGDDPAEAILHVCGREHFHRYVDSTRYPVHITVSKIAPA